MTTSASEADEPPSLQLHMRASAYNNAWANHRLLRACAQLAPDEFGAPRTGFFPSLRGTLNHIITVDWFYLDAIERSLGAQSPNPDPGQFFRPAKPFADCASLATAQRAADSRLVALCERLRESELARIIVVPRRDHEQRERLDRLLAHLFQHQIHHRGQAHAMLSGTRVAPPQLDEFYSVEEAPLRVRDFAELGFDESRIWGPR